jgi:hypothetical protein
MSITRVNSAAASSIAPTAKALLDRRAFNGTAAMAKTELASVAVVEDDEHAREALIFQLDTAGRLTSLGGELPGCVRGNMVPRCHILCLGIELEISPLANEQLSPESLEIESGLTRGGHMPNSVCKSAEECIYRRNFEVIR